MDLNFLSTYGLTIIGALVFLVSLITEVTKGIGFLARIPTALQVIVLSEILTIIVYAGYCSFNGIDYVWYGFTGAAVAGFVVAFISLFGWEKLTALWTRCKK